MFGISFAIHDQTVGLQLPEELRADAELLFGRWRGVSGPCNHSLSVRKEDAEHYSLRADDKRHVATLGSEAVWTALLEEIVYALIVDLDKAVAIHAGLVGWQDKAILIAGRSGVGKSSLAAWFVANGFQYLADELVILDSDGLLDGFPRPLILKPGSADVIASLPGFAGKRTIAAGANTILCPDQVDSSRPRSCGLIIFPQYAPEADLAIRPISAAEAGLKLMECNLNARNLPDHGFGAVTGLARTAAAVELTYSDCGQLDSALDVFVKLALDGDCAPPDLRRIMSAFCRSTASNAKPPTVRRESPPATAQRYPRKLTVGMATYDDYDGVYFSIQALRLYHPEILDETEFVLVDNHPHGPAAPALKDLERVIPTYRYVPYAEKTGTAVRDAIFREASGKFVLCLDCHVLIVRNALKRLLDYFDENAGTIDLLQGPLLYDDTKKIASHFKPEWRGGMYGTWEPSSAAEDPDAPPFEIPMQGLGLFACRRAAWPGFNPNFRGFGGEEGYIHEKFRRAGGRTLCLPFLRWMHRFNRPLGTPYANTWEDRLRNYMIGFNELGLDTAAMEEHFAGLLGASVVSRIIESVREEEPTLLVQDRSQRVTSRDLVSAG